LPRGSDIRYSATFHVRDATARIWPIPAMTSATMSYSVGPVVLCAHRRTWANSSTFWRSRGQPGGPPIAPAHALGGRLRTFPSIVPYTSVREDAALTEATQDWLGVERLYREEGPKLWRSIMSFAGDRSIADEAVAEAFAQLLGRGNAVRAPSAWVWRAAFRIASGELKARRESGPEPASLSYEPPDPVPEVLTALAALPRMQRAVVVLHDYADRPTAEIADTLGISRSTVRVHLSQARRKLRNLLEDDR
jgi:RNA polymerase sigma factor (sigma-70 family)